MLLSLLQQALLVHLLPQTASATYWQLIDRFGSINNALAQNHEQLASVMHESALSELHCFEDRGESSPLYQRLSRELDLVEQHNVELLSVEFDTYPELLRQIVNPPPLLYVKGDIRALSMPQVAMVGSRHPSPLGQELATDFARQLANNGFGVCSGLALGIDACAHRGALLATAEKSAKTIAVLGSGLANIYPKRNFPLAQEIVESGGALVSEQPMTMGALAHHFPKRNRIVSGLSCGVLVVEAALKSGSLITARLALEQDREVFAIPGSIRSVVSRGCHQLIKTGAKLVESPADIVQELRGFMGFYQESLDFSACSNIEDSITEQANSAVEIEGLNEEEKRILNHIGYEETPVELLQIRLGTSISALANIVLNLEIKGLIENTGLGYIRL